MEQQSVAGSSRAVVTPQEQRIIDSNLQRVLRLPGNDCCADCGSKHPRWASVNLGVVICLECSGVHRKMGVHISKVKSATLDRWTAQWVAVLEAIGNDVAKKYYEHALPADFKRPTRSDDPNTIENWIRTKYERKNYAPKGIPEPWMLVAEGKDPRSVLAAASEEKVEPESRKTQASEAKKPTAPAAPANEPWLLSEVEDFAAFGSQPAAPAATTAAAPEPQLSATDQRVQAAKATIARLYAAPNQLGFGAATQPAVRPESLEGLCFFNTPQQQQQQQAGGLGGAAGAATNAGGAVAADWANWGAVQTPAAAAAVWPGASSSTTSSSFINSFSSLSVGFGATTSSFGAPPAAAAAPPQLQRPVAAAAAPAAGGDPWGSCGARLNGQGAACSPVSDSSKQAQCALSALDAFALARKVQQQQPAAPSSSSPPSGKNQQEQEPRTAPATPSPVAVQQQEPLLLI
ncbi:hypothetical protein Emed_002549 [Eimeria media]